MPRLTSTEYLDAHYLLRRAHAEEPLLLNTMTPQQQWILHAYFVPTKKLTDQELLDHRAAITAEQSSLPQRAGRAYAQLTRNAGIAARHSQGDHALFRQVLSELVPGEAYVTKRGKRISIVGVARPEPDAKLFAQVVPEMARELQRRAAQDDEGTK
jgi:hypothetical protein